MTPEQREIRELRDQLARVAASKVDEAVPEFPAAPETEDEVLIHFLEDGLTFGGIMGYRGQEFRFVPGTPAWEDTLNRHGKSWVTFTDEEQYRAWNKRYFGRGPWPGKPWEGPAADAENSRARNAPVFRA